MRVKMRARISGTRNGQDWPAPGGLIDLPDTEAVDLLNAGLAVAPDEDDEPETATTPQPTRRGGKRSIKAQPPAPADAPVAADADEAGDPDETED